MANVVVAVTPPGAMPDSIKPCSRVPTDPFTTRSVLLTKPKLRRVAATAATVRRLGVFTVFRPRVFRVGANKSKNEATNENRQNNGRIVADIGRKAADQRQKPAG